MFFFFYFSRRLHVIYPTWLPLSSYLVMGHLEMW